MRKQTTASKWEKLDNTANLFPVIATENMTNVYRISVVLTEEIIPSLLQEALEEVLPSFAYMDVQMRTGVFWYYFETNQRKAPAVKEEDEFPCRYIPPHKNNHYLFRVTYYKKRINLEVFHVLSDGMGGVNFLRELTYAYLRRVHPELSEGQDDFSGQTSFNHEDSYVKNYRKPQAKGYKSGEALHIHGEKLPKDSLGVMHGYMSVSALKERSHVLKVSINEYLAGIYTYAIWKEWGKQKNKPIVVCVPVNLRPYFDSMTTRNFFVMVSSTFLPEKESCTVEEVIQEVAANLRRQMKVEALEKLFSYNVSNQKNLMLRAVPLLLKKYAIKFVYYNSAKATTTTLTNIGNFLLDKKYEPYISHTQALLSMSTGQNIKAAISSCGDILTLTFTTILRDVSIQKEVFRTLAKDGIEVSIETNGVSED